MASCMRSTNYAISSDTVKYETLISELQGKIITNGVIHFLRYENDTIRIISYYCQIHEKSKTVCCQRVEDSNSFMSTNNYSGFYTTSLFKSHIEKNPSWKRYYNCFSENFLDLTNDEKIKVLEEIASRCEK